MPTGYYQKRVLKAVKIFQKNKKPKSKNMVLNNLVILLKKKETKLTSMIVS